MRGFICGYCSDSGTMIKSAGSMVLVAPCQCRQDVSGETKQLISELSNKLERDEYVVKKTAYGNSEVKGVTS